MTGSVWETRRGRFLVELAVVLAFLAFPVASVSAFITLHERNQRVELAVRIAQENQRRIERACLRTGALVRAIDRLSVSPPGTAAELEEELDRINRMFPDLPSCPVGGR